jgi:hypothetical protein
MKLFRLKGVTQAFALFTGIIFLNMSFVLAEVAAIKMDQDKQLLGNIAALFAGCSAEEETGNSADEDSSVCEIDLILHHAHRHSVYHELLFKNKAGITTVGLPQLGHYEIYSPPPEV